MRDEYWELHAAILPDAFHEVQRVGLGVRAVDGDAQIHDVVITTLGCRTRVEDGGNSWRRRGQPAVDRARRHGRLCPSCVGTRLFRITVARRTADVLWTASSRQKGPRVALGDGGTSDGRRWSTGCSRCGVGQAAGQAEDVERVAMATTRTRRQSRKQQRLHCRVFVDCVTDVMLTQQAFPESQPTPYTP